MERQNDDMRFLTQDQLRRQDKTLAIWRAVIALVHRDSGITRADIHTRMPQAPAALVDNLLENNLLVEVGGCLKPSPEGEAFYRLDHEQRMTLVPGLPRRMIH